MEPLPYIDEHGVVVDADRERVWAALGSVVDGTLRSAGRSPLRRLLGTEPREGFAIAESVDLERLVLHGRHRFSRYELRFDLVGVGAASTRVRATTYAAFPGPQGRAYRGLVIGTRLHVLATRRILAAVARRATATPR